MNLLPILKNYQNGYRNAKVYQTNSGDYGVLTYDATDDHNGFDTFTILEEAYHYAEKWVNNYDPI
jgi:hypothetical protein